MVKLKTPEPTGTDTAVEFSQISIMHNSYDIILHWTNENFQIQSKNQCDCILSDIRRLTRNKGTTIARYETRRSCKNGCEWEILKLHVGNAFERVNGGEIVIKRTGTYSIVAQLHNKHGNNGYWMRTNIKINGSVRSKR